MFLPFPQEIFCYSIKYNKNTIVYTLISVCTIFIYILYKLYKLIWEDLVHNSIIYLWSNNDYAEGTIGTKYKILMLSSVARNNIKTI